MFYYGYWKPANVTVVVASIVLNWLLGRGMRTRPWLFWLGMALDLGSLGWFKYTDFVLGTVNAVFGTGLPMMNVVLPIGISFFTFQQIAYLADIRRGVHDPGAEGFLDYCCFVCFFPQLVAGPIVHHHEMMPQFADAGNRRLNWDNVYAGLVMLAIGLAKKVLIADRLSPVVRYAFDLSPSLSFVDAAFATLCYTLQLYFDFSGYSDMAVGCALFFNIRLPRNFLSPYKAASIRDFWRRWHVTLSRWLRDYLYIPLGGSRGGMGRTCLNLFLTFVLGGLWHGAAWTFVVWGVMHGAALCVHRLWSSAGRRLPFLVGWAATFCFVNAAWIVFRAQDLATIRKFAEGFMGRSGFWLTHALREGIAGQGDLVSNRALSLLVAASLAVTFACPDSSSLMERKPSLRMAVLAAVLLALSTMLVAMPNVRQEFIYFQF